MFDQAQIRALAWGKTIMSLRYKWDQVVRGRFRQMMTPLGNGYLRHQTSC
jgi:hypothetical protein